MSASWTDHLTLRPKLSPKAVLRPRSLEKPRDLYGAAAVSAEKSGRVYDLGSSWDEDKVTGRDRIRERDNPVGSKDGLLVCLL